MASDKELAAQQAGRQKAIDNGTDDIESDQISDLIDQEEERQSKNPPSGA
jgi:hypothetical protein